MVDSMHMKAPNPQGAMLWRWLNQASEAWVEVNLADLTAAEGAAVGGLVRSGQFQLRQQVDARGGPDEPHVRATCVVTGDFKQALLRALRGAVPEFSDRLVVYPASTAQYRLSGAGVATQAEIRQFGGGAFEEDFLAKSLGFAIPGVVQITDLQYLPPETPKAPEPPEAAADPPAPGLSESDGPAKAAARRTFAWPVPRTEGHVAAYHAARKSEYLTLGRDVLDDKTGAQDQFKKVFGPSAIARALTEKLGTNVHRACRAQDVLKTHTYRNLIQPLIRQPPRKPVDWDEMIAGRVGEDLPEILEEIPFEDEQA